MNALQQRMMANAMSRTGMGLEEMSAYVEEEDPTHAELEGGAMGPVPATQRAKLIKYGRRHIPAIGPLKINSVLLSKEYGRTQDERNEWNADPANKKQKALLQKAYAARQMYSNLRNSGDPESFNKIINLCCSSRSSSSEVIFALQILFYYVVNLLYKYFITVIEFYYPNPILCYSISH